MILLRRHKNIVCSRIFRKRYRKGTKYSFSKISNVHNPPFYQYFTKFSHNFSTHCLTVLTIRAITNLVTGIHEMPCAHTVVITRYLAGMEVCYEHSEVYTKIRGGDQRL